MAKLMTNNQGLEFARLGRDKGIPCSAFEDAKKDGRVDDFFVGLIPTQFIIVVDYGQSFEEMVTAGEYDWRNYDLNEESLPIKGKGKKYFECKLFPADCSSEGGVKRIAAEDKKKPWQAGETEHILAFGSTFTELQRKNPIVGLGSTAQVRGCREVPCLGRVAGQGRYLGLGWWHVGWPSRWVLLGIREISGPVT